MSGYRTPWAVLDIEPTNDDRAIRKAYSAKLKQIDVENDPAAFIELRSAMEQARRMAAYQAEREADDDEDYFDEDYAYGGGDSDDGEQNGYSKRGIAPAPQDRIDGIEILLSPAARLQLVAALFEGAKGADVTAPVHAAPVPPVADVPHYAGGDLVPPVLRRKMTVAGERVIPLPVPSCDILFPAQTPLLADMLRRRAAPDTASLVAPSVAPATGPSTDDTAPVNAKAAPLYPPVEEDEAHPGLGNAAATAAPPFPLYPPVADPDEDGPDREDGEAQAEPDAPPVAPDPVNLDSVYPDVDAPDYERWADFQGAVSFRRDDWGNADRERIAELLNGSTFGPAEAAEVDHLTDRLLASDHLDAIDYRDFMENWFAAIIADRLPRSDSVLAKASAKFLWGTQTGQLHSSPALDACFGRNRDLEAEQKLRDTSHKYHKIYEMLKQPAPDKLSAFRRASYADVRDFLDAIRTERPTLEWSLDERHVAMWDAGINNWLNNETRPAQEARFKWYHGLFIAFLLCQMLIRCVAGTEDRSFADTMSSPPAKSASTLVDYESRARAGGNKAVSFERFKLAKRFNDAIRLDDDPAFRRVRSLPPAVNISQYVKMDDLLAYVHNRCDADCTLRITQTLEALAQTTVTVGDPVLQAPAEQPLKISYPEKSSDRSTDR